MPVQREILFGDDLLGIGIGRGVRALEELNEHGCKARE